MTEPTGAYFEWGASGARSLLGRCAAIVVVDVLSFTTTVTLATGRGTAVFPCANSDAGGDLAERFRASLAVGRNETTPERPWSLSPASVATGRLPERLVLASPNGAAISALVAGHGLPVVAASLRNASAVAAAVLSAGLGTEESAVGVIASGERWSDGSLRPAIEDLFGAGLVLSSLAASGARLSAEATVAARSVTGLPVAQLADLVRASTSGSELRVAGYGEDVELATAIGADDLTPVIPVMAVDSGAFRTDARLAP